MHLEGGIGEVAAIPSGEAIGGTWNRLEGGASEEDGRRVFVFDEADLALWEGVDHGKGGVGDMTLGADGERIHNKGCSATQTNISAHVFHCHGGGEGGADVGLLATAEAVGEDSDDRAVTLALTKEDVTATNFFEFVAVKPVDFDEGVGEAVGIVHGSVPCWG